MTDDERTTMEQLTWVAEWYLLSHAENLCNQYPQDYPDEACIIAKARQAMCGHIHSEEAAI